MKALAVCATYGRLPYLGKMLAGFARQTYDDKHLIIINDDKNIHLCCDRKDVSIINCNTRMSVADKRNVGISFGDYDVIFPWDDDDVYYPAKIANHIKKYESGEVSAYRNLCIYMQYGNIFDIKDDYGHNNISFLKKEWYRVGGYTNSAYEDVDIHNRLNALVEYDPLNRDFCCGFGGINYHLSCGHNQLDGLAYIQLNKMNLIGGKFLITEDDMEYNKYIRLKEICDTTKNSVQINHIGDGLIDISHLL